MARETRSALTASAAPVQRQKYRHVPMSDMIAASAKMDTLGSTNGTGHRGSTQSRSWQREAWTFYEEVGEARYTARFIAACLSRCRLTVGIPDKRGKVGPAFDEAGEPLADNDGKVLPGLENAEAASELIQALRNPVGGQGQLLADMGLNLAVAGEFHLVGRAPDSDGADASVTLRDAAAMDWDVMSTDEFYPGDKVYLHKPTPNATPEEIDATAVHVVRLWRSHPRFKALPDSMFMAVREVLDELVLLTREVQAEALSRIANSKVFGVPVEIEWGGSDTNDADSEDGDPLTRDMLVKMSAAITDKGSAAAVAPFVLRGPGEWLEKCQVWDLSPDHSSDSAAKRAEAIMRFAQGVDLPVEIVTSHMNTTFANAVVIDDSLFKSHIEPVLEIVCDGLTAGYLRPALAAQGVVDTPLVVHYDSGELVSRPNRGQDAKELHDRFALSDASLRHSCGFSDNDAPDEEEMERRISFRQLASPLALSQIGKAKTVTPVESDGSSSENKVPGGEKAPGGEITQGQEVPSIAAALEAMAEITVEQAVVRAGNRLRSFANRRQPTIRAQLSQVPAAEVPVTLGPTLVGQLAEGEDLFHGQFDALWSLTVRRTGDQNYADSLTAACVEVANERLYQPRRTFPFARLPRYVERGVLEVAS